MNQTFDRFREWLAANYEEGLHSLNPPATDQELEELQATLGYPLPPDLVNFLQVHNGQKSESGWLIDGQELLSSHRIIDEWKVWQGLLDSGDFDGITSEPQDGIKNSWWNKKWIPITYNGFGDHYCIDLDPAENGTSGQVITMFHDEGVRGLLSSSLDEWFKSYVEDLFSGKFVYSHEYGSIVNQQDI